MVAAMMAVTEQTFLKGIRWLSAEANGWYGSLYVIHDDTYLIIKIGRC